MRNGRQECGKIMHYHTGPTRGSNGKPTFSVIKCTAFGEGHMTDIVFHI
jgi:hypothetical protein